MPWPTNIYSLPLFKAILTIILGRETKTFFFSSLVDVEKCQLGMKKGNTRSVAESMSVSEQLRLPLNKPKNSQLSTDNK